jgi:diadenosine tetraphosphatase ApaH/serine/threonine PP2A family protein phosphatase
MRLGALSDVHSNLEALKAALEFFEEEEITQHLFLGDLVGYGANPNECVELIRKLRCAGVAGNHDFGVLKKTPLDDFNPAAAEALMWTRDQLREETKLYIDSLELTERFDPCFLVHGAPSSPSSWEYIFTLKEAIYEFSCFSSRVCLIGHTHYPFAMVKTPDGSFNLIKEEEFIIENNNRYLINVGSVGQPRDGDPRACVAVFDTKTNKFNFKRLEYDINSAQKKIVEAGLPPYLANRLAQGR